MVLEEVIDAEKNLTLVGIASDGDELLKQMKLQEADVVIVDADLPKNIRLFTLKRIFSEAPVPVLLLLTPAQLTLELLQEATELGVYAVVLKPTVTQRLNYRSLSAEVVAKINAVRQLAFREAKDRLQLLRQEVELTSPEPVRRKPVTAETIVVIGASTGGPQAVEAIVKKLSPAINACILVAVHLPPRFTRSFANRLKELTSLTVLEGRIGLSLRPGKIIVAPGGKNMVVEAVMGNAANPRIGFTDEPAALYDQPSVDLLMKSVAASAVQNVIGVILTGMGRDGTIGAGYIKDRGGVIIAQNEASCAIFGMAKSAIESGCTSEVLPLSQIPHFINTYAAYGNKVSETDDVT